MDQVIVDDYAQAISEGANLPAIVVFHDADDAYWLADGFHRHVAAERETIEADVREGSRRDAVLYSVGANTTHGLRRSNSDKQNAVMMLLRDPEWGKWSDREIGKRAGVDHKTIGRMRAIVGTAPTERTFTSRHGTVATRRVEKVDGEFPIDQSPPNPSTAFLRSLSEVVRHATQIEAAVARGEADAKPVREAMKAAMRAIAKIDKRLAEMAPEEAA
jgi:hypothetical protein